MAKQYLSYETRQGVKKTTSGFLSNPQLVQKLPVQQNKLTALGTEQALPHGK